jgi:ABC-type glycerol-3-phosphate transport system substrate-binding protein
VTLTAYLGASGELPQRFDSEVAQAYAKQRPNVTVQLLPQPSGGEAGMREKLQVLIAGGTPPDLWEYATIAETMVKYDWLVSVEDYVRRDRYDLNVYAKGLFDHVARYQGKTWIIPYGHGGNTMVMALNPQLFAEAGVALPGTGLQNTWSWNDWVEALRKLTKQQGTDIAQFGVADPGSWLASPPCSGRPTGSPPISARSFATTPTWSTATPATSSCPTGTTSPPDLARSSRRLG